MMTFDDKIRDEKLQYDIIRVAPKISALSSGKVDKHEYLTGEEILPPDQISIMKQDKLTYYPLGIAFKNKYKQLEIKKKQVEALKVLKPVEDQQKPESNEGIFPKDLESSKIKNERNKIKKLEE